MARLYFHLTNAKSFVFCINSFINTYNISYFFDSHIRRTSREKVVASTCPEGFSPLPALTDEIWPVQGGNGHRLPGLTNGMYSPCYSAACLFS